MDGNLPGLNEAEPYFFGVTWDFYTPAVEGQLVKDIIAMTQAKVKCTLKVACIHSQADRVFKSFGIERIGAETLATLWITYQTEEEPVHAPDHAHIVVERNLYQPKSNGYINMVHNDKGYYLPPQGRIGPDSINMYRPAPNGYAPIDPALIMLWSSLVHVSQQAK